MATLYSTNKSLKFLSVLALIKTANIQLKLEKLYWIKLDSNGKPTYWSDKPLPTTFYTNPNLTYYLYEPRLWELPDGGAVVLSKLSLNQIETLANELNKRLG